MLIEQHKGVETGQSVADVFPLEGHLDPSMGDSTLPASPLLRLEAGATDAAVPRTISFATQGILVKEVMWYGFANGLARQRRIGLILSPPRLLRLAMLVFLAVPMARGQVAPSASLAPSPASPTNSIPQPPPPPLLTSAPSNGPSRTLEPTPAPSNSTQPSLTPSNLPSTHPSLLPTVTPGPTAEPSVAPTDAPSFLPSFNPTAEPTFVLPISSSAVFRQKLTPVNGRLLTPAEETLFQNLYESYTVNFGPRMGIDDGRINTTCFVREQTGYFGRRLSLRDPRGDYESHRRNLQAFSTIELEFSMSFLSIHTNVTGYPDLFKAYLDENLDDVLVVLQETGLNVSDIERASKVSVETDAPTATSSPTISPSFSPTFSFKPSQIPSDWPSLAPSSMVPFPTSEPSDAPANRLEPSSGPEGGGSPAGGVSDNTVIVVSVVVAGSIILIGLLVYIRRRKLLQELAFQTSAAAGSRKTSRAGVPVDEGTGSWGAAVRKPTGHENSSTPGTGADGSAYKGHYSGKAPPVPSSGGVVSPSESRNTNDSLLSAGNSMAGDSGDEADGTHNLADEFDQYKDQNLEKMRADVEGNLTGFDGMMSQALTKALIDDDEAPVEPSEYLWGAPTLTGCEIEASALGEVTDWLKRKDNASVEEKRAFMQDTLNKMVASVRYGVLGPIDASRSIHECAALLGLELASEIPVETLIISGMRKTVAAEDIMEAFREFGDILDVAVSSNQRGFGILRFKTPKSAQRALMKFRTEEIVVQDVAVQVKRLSPGGASSGPDGSGKAAAGANPSNANIV